MDVDPSRLPVMNFTVDDCGVGASFHLKPSYPVVVNITRIKVTLRTEIQAKFKTLFKPKFCPQ
jgi:hypothetical protein